MTATEPRSVRPAAPASVRRKSVFWRIAGAILIAQLLTGLFAILLSAYLANDRSAELTESSIRERADVLALEIERLGAPLDRGLAELPDQILSNLSLRFPDPVALVDSGGQLLETFYPSSQAYPGLIVDTTRIVHIPDNIVAVLDEGRVVVDRSSDLLPGGWVAAPIYDGRGFLVGGFVVQPISETVFRELEPTRSAYRAAIVTVILISVLMASLLAAGFTWWMVRPLRQIAARVEEIGAGNYSARVHVRGEDEIGRLGASVNLMAEHVAQSVETLKTSDRLRRELVANVGHDLRTPLAAMKAHIEEGLRYYADGRSASVLSSLESAARQGEYLQHLVDDLFELSQLENPAPSLRLEPVPVAELLTDAVRRHRPTFEAKGILFELQIPGSVPVIEADGVRLLRVLDNLLTNAGEFTDQGGTITLSCKVSDVDIAISVSDTGRGMSGEELARIFDRYYRGETSRTRSRSGTGLGLAISRAVAHSHGGTLHASSTPGLGSTLLLTLPRTKSASGKEGA